MAAPFFSVVLPTYNRSRMARTAIRTVQLQTFKEWECLVADDGSTDDTQAMLAEFSGDPRVKPIRLAKNQGMNAARNKAVAQATGRFVTFLDSDDLWLPRRLELFHARVQKSPDAGFLFSNAYLLRHGRLMGLLFDPGRPIPEGKLPGSYAIGEAQLPYVTTNVAVLREGFARLGAFTETLTTDTDLWARFIAGGFPIAAIREPVSVRRVHGEQLSSKYVSNFEELQAAIAQTGADAATRQRLREDMCREVASYLIKSAKPREAREFLVKILGESARSTSLYKLALVPAPALRLAKTIRKCWLLLRHHPCWAGADAREVYSFINPLLEQEAS